MSETIWQPSLLYPGRVHASGAQGQALCGAELDPAPVRCTLCALTTAGSAPHATTDVREHIENDCADCAEPEPDLLLTLRDSDLDTEADAQYATIHSALAVENLIAAAYADAERILATIDVAPPSVRARSARAHLIETLVTLNESLTRYDYVIRSLRSGEGATST